MEFHVLIFYAGLRLRFLDMETNRGPRDPVPAVYRILSNNGHGLAGSLSDLTLASSQYDIILLCSEILVSDMRPVMELLVPGFRRPVLLCRGLMPRA